MKHQRSFNQQERVEVLFGHWRGQTGTVQKALGSQEWLVQLARQDEHGRVLLALNADQFRRL
ncbi:hypothetical protein [Gloeobacter kilaueensis]|uniref:Uncharacterized protein n=1 Tax=Gloeobacter kilaueensis (strain ATCC BAA-2537 / CCAP 1431/1 / ULC 316 / JS1) TaxID=1183438 RepID=U5QJ05_GLOK1|nr:hypothetical protein [Gloeobacter kilaueensis]AGY58833.1 hypothetical protein GKIL_2587 [Gloeobacter kilaueensis JS1]